MFADSGYHAVDARLDGDGSEAALEGLSHRIAVMLAVEFGHLVFDRGDLIWLPPLALRDGMIRKENRLGHRAWTNAPAIGGIGLAHPRNLRRRLSDPPRPSGTFPTAKARKPSTGWAEARRIRTLATVGFSGARAGTEFFAASA
jgi:hypothetical protein